MATCRIEASQICSAHLAIGCEIHRASVAARLLRLSAGCAVWHDTERLEVCLSEIIYDAIS